MIGEDFEMISTDRNTYFDGINKGLNVNKLEREIWPEGTEQGECILISDCSRFN